MRRLLGSLDVLPFMLPVSYANFSTGVAGHRTLSWCSHAHRATDCARAARQLYCAVQRRLQAGGYANEAGAAHTAPT
eukprot:6174011-Pleurochrysis_carterae.AAC.1